MAKMNFGFKGSKGVSIDDPLFLYVEFSESGHPKNNRELNDLIEELDLDNFTNAKDGIKYNLPFLTFKQAELLFRGIRDHFGVYPINGVALMSQVSSSGKFTGKTSFKVSPMISPFDINKGYDNIVIPLVEATRKDERFKHYSHEELANYFTSVEYNLFDCYANSLGLSRSEYPLYPGPGQVVGEYPRDDSSTQSTGNVGNKAREEFYSIEQKKSVIDKVALGVGTLGLLVGLLGVGLAMNTNGKLEKQNKQILHVYQEATAVTELQAIEHQADVVGRYFLTRYFTGDKESIKPYLSNGDAKYTQPEAATIVSTLMENIEHTSEDSVYKVTYIIGMKIGENESQVKRVSFMMQKNEDAEYGWYVTSEPIFSNFMSN